jgi:putative transposase
MIHRTLRADRLRHSMNAGKAAKLACFIRHYRQVAVALGRVQWRLFFETGVTNGRMPAKHLNSICGAAPVQMASAQVVEQLDGWVSNRANDFVDLVRGSTLPVETKKVLYAINRRRAWFFRGELPGIDEAERVLARRIMRQAMKRHHRPDVAHISPRLDVRVASVTSSRKAKHAGFWASLRLPGRGRLDIPLHPHRHFLDRGGKLCPIVQLCTEAGGTIGIRLVSDITEPVAVSRAAYEPEIDALGIDFGLATLLATSEGDLFGRGLLADLVRIDRQITGIARHRMRSGDKPRNSARYRQLVTRVRGMLRTRINAALNRLVAVHKPAVLRIERLDFRSPHLSRRVNRLVTNCGRAVFKAKLVDLEERFGILADQMPSPYTSQECSKCHYIDRANRRSQSEFVCRFCGHRKHADVNAACTVKGRRSAGLGDRFLTKGAILAKLIRQFCERFPQPQGAAADPRFANRHFAGWAAAARNALMTQDLVPCAQKR